jgi:hypothetical protein
MTTATPTSTPAITDETIAAMREDLHRPWPSQGWNTTAGSDAVWHFALGLGDDNPLWWPRDRSAAPGGAPLSAPVSAQVPPTFLYSCDNAPIVAGLMQTASGGGVDTWLPGALGLWAGDRWVWHDHIAIDEPISSTAELWEVRERDSSFSGRSVAQTMRTTFTGAGDRPLAECFRTIFRFERSAMNPDRYMTIEPAHYTPADRDRLRAQYLAEAANRRGDVPRYWDDVRIGDELPTLLKGPLTITEIVSWVLGWGSPMCQSDRIGAQFLDLVPGAGIMHPDYGFEDTIEGPHWDDRLSRLGGYPRGYDFGCQRISWLSHCVTDWCGDAGRLADLDARLLRPNLIGDTTWITGQVTGKRREDTRTVVTCALEGRNQRNETTVSGVATVELPVTAG